MYYQRPLPDHIQAGYTLRPEDVQELQVLLSRRDTYTKFLYEREKEFSESLAGRDWLLGNEKTRVRELEREIEKTIEEHNRYLQAINVSPTFRIGKALTWPARTLRSMLKGK